ncbi:cupin domain-containing protein [Candidatus Woesearchaeota archaeon]|nr:cupin domain-containing protein [Candidatus Woesearchaeota archaeon]
MIIKESDCQERKAYGVRFKTLATGDRIMCTIMRGSKGDKVPAHNHPAEQIGYVIKGRFKLFIDGKEDGVLCSRDSYVVKGGQTHAMEIMADAEWIDTFSPPREEYR